MSFLGNALLVLASLATVYGIVTFLLGTGKGKEQSTRQGRQAAYFASIFMTLAVGLLLVALLSHDFSLNYVYSESAADTPLIYLISALWAGNPGSLLFWGWLVSLVAALLLWRNRVQKQILSYAVPAVLFTLAFFLILIFLENPFTGLYPVPSEGLGLNPLLQNLGMVFHPPSLLAGWALLVAPFGIAVGSLITRRLDSEWLASARRWALAAWIFLGVGNILGAWWAYYELGWGGYWAWDPVENAGLMPWLLVTAFLHSTMIQRRRGLNKSWNMLLIIFAFLLTIFGAYLTRSDILNSVHTFGQTPAEPVFLAFMAVVLVGSVALVFMRHKNLRDEPGDDVLVSGETTFFANNLLFVLATLVILIGTIFPWLSRVFTGTQVEQDASFFNTFAVPLFLAIILLAGLCIIIGFKKPVLSRLGRSLLWPAGVAILAVVLLVIFGISKWYVLASAFAMAFALGATLFKSARDIAQSNASKSESWLKTGRRLFYGNRARYGGYIIHLAIVIIAVGVMGSSVYDVHLDEVVLSPGQSVDIQAYTVTYNGYTAASTQDSMTITANVDLSRSGRIIYTLHPQLYYSALRDTTISEAAVRSTLADDVYISLYNADASQNAGFTILVNPLVDWIWIGGMILLLGGIWAFGAQSKKLFAE
jgi:cytochrome c-type biogenesis protein CcmF